MTASLWLWTNAHDAEVRVKPGPGAWYRCPTCHTKWRPIGRYIRPNTVYVLRVITGARFDRLED